MRASSLLDRWPLRRRAAPVEARACPVCAAADLRFIGHLDATAAIAFERNRYDLVECRACELIYISPEPSAADLNALYVGSNQFTDALYTDAKRVEAILEYMTSCLTRILARAGIDRREPIATLEIGAGLAWMARAAKALNPASATTAEDISPEAVHQCPWVDAYVQADVADPRVDGRAPYDLISLTHVIEHLTDPVSVIARCKRLLSARGTILVTAPHRPLGWSRGSGDIALWRSYSYNHVPAHIQYFSQKSMGVLARNAGCRLAYWDARSEGGQAFEAWLSSPR